MDSLGYWCYDCESGQFELIRASSGYTYWKSSVIETLDNWSMHFHRDINCNYHLASQIALTGIDRPASTCLDLAAASDCSHVDRPDCRLRPLPPAETPHQHRRLPDHRSLDQHLRLAVCRLATRACSGCLPHADRHDITERQTADDQQ